MALEMKNRAFWLDGRPHFFYGGEMHYFRLPPSQWADQLRRIREMGITTVSTYVPWLWHEPQSQAFDFTGQTHPQRNLTVFLSLAWEAGLTVFIRPGPYVMAELRQEGIPAWFQADFPEAMAQGSDGEPHPTGLVSYLHPAFLGRVDNWYAHLAGAIRPYFSGSGGPIVMTQVDNEIGMLHWVSGMRDHHPLVQDRYQEFCRATQADPASYWTWGQFWRTYRAEYAEHLTTLAQAHGFPGPYVVNVHGFRDYSFYSRGVDYPIGLSQLSWVSTSSKRVLGGDFYPGHVTYDNFHDLVLATLYTQSVNHGDAATFSPEFQAGRFQDRPHLNASDLELSARVSMASGLNGINWYMLSSGENPDNIGVFGKDHNWQAPVGLKGEYRPSAKVVEHLGTLLKSYGASLVQSQVQPDIHIGFYSAYYMTEEAERHGKSGPVIERIVRQRETLHFDGIYRILVAANVQVQALWIDGPTNLLDPFICPSLWIATTRYMDADSQERLAQYVESGGILIMGPEIPDQDLNAEPCRILLEALNLSQPTSAGHRGTADIGSWRSVYCPQYATFPDNLSQSVWGRLSPGGDVLIFGHAVGQGRVVVVGVGWPSLYDGYHGMIRELLAAITARPLTLMSEDPSIHALVRQGPSGNFLFAHNFSETALDTHVTFSIDADQTLTWPLSIEARQGLMLPFGGVELPQSRVLVEFTTAEISQGEEMSLWIHRSCRAGYAVLQSLGPGEPAVAIRSGAGSVSVNGDRVTVVWDHAQKPDPISLTCLSDELPARGLGTVPVQTSYQKKEDY